LVDEAQIRGFWNNFYTAIGYINYVLEDMDRLDLRALGVSVEEEKDWRGQLRGLRALAHMHLLCNFGGIPIATRTSTTPLSPARNTNVEVFNWIENELLDILREDMLPPLRQVHAGKLTRAGVMAILVDLYLNAEVYTGNQSTGTPGTARWDDVITFADYLITGTSPYGPTGNSQTGATATPGTPRLDFDIDVTFAANNRTAST
jgi:hypothetical protein